jgi:hypothetical protein
MIPRSRSRSCSTPTRGPLFRTAQRIRTGRAPHPQIKTSLIHVNAGLGGDVSSAARGIAHAIIGPREKGVNLTHVPCGFVRSRAFQGK